MTITPPRIPGTTLFDGDQAQKGYALNKMCFSFNSADNRNTFQADEAAYILRHAELFGFSLTDQKLLAALVRLQRGEADKAIVDFDASLKLGAPRAMTLYLRGYAKRSAGPSGAGEADMNQAMELDATVAERTKWLEPTPR